MVLFYQEDPKEKTALKASFFNIVKNEHGNLQAILVLLEVPLILHFQVVPYLLFDLQFLVDLVFLVDLLLLLVL